MRYIVAKEVKSETKVYKNLYLFDLFFVVIYFAVSMVMGNAVHEKVRFAFYVYSVFCALFLTAKSRTNRKRRNYESIILFLRRDKEIYYPVMNYSKATHTVRSEEEEI